MTIKELCTKVREAAERALAEDNQGALSGPNYSRFENLYPDTGAHHRTANPTAVLALLGRIEELEKALGDLLAANDGVQNELCNGPEVPDFDPMALGRAQLRVDEAERVARRLLPGDTR